MLSGVFTFASPWLAVFWVLLAGLFVYVHFALKRHPWHYGWFAVAALLTAAGVVFAPPHVFEDMRWWVPQVGVFIVLALVGLLVSGINFLLDGMLFAPRAAAGVTRSPFGPFERTLALRYLGAKREHGGLAFISIVSVVGITLGVWALILTMSIMNGFRLELIDKIVGFEPHVVVETVGAPTSVVEDLIVDLGKRPGVDRVEPLLDGTALASARGRSAGVQVRGVRPEDLRKNKLISDSIAAGQKLRDNPDGPWPTTPVGQGSLDHFGDDGALSQDIVLGDSFAYELGVGVGDRITLTQANGPRTVVGTAPRTKTYTVTAIFHVGREQYDRGIAFLPIEAAKLMFSVDEGYPLVGIRMKDPNAAEDLLKVLETQKPFRMQTWQTRNGSYVSALVVERNVMRLILFVVVVITALNIITGVLMLVKNKARDIAILRTIGATRGGVVRVFMMTGTVLGMTGVATGVLFGVLSAVFIADIQHFVENAIRLVNPAFEGLFPASIYQLDSLPAKLEWDEVWLVGGMAFFVTLVMSIIPSMWAARLNPVEALRFE